MRRGSKHSSESRLKTSQSCRAYWTEDRRRAFGETVRRPMADPARREARLKKLHETLARKRALSDSRPEGR